MNMFSRLQKFMYLILMIINNSRVPLSARSIEQDYFFNELKGRGAKEIQETKKNKNSNRGSNFLDMLVNYKNLLSIRRTSLAENMYLLREVDKLTP